MSEAVEKADGPSQVQPGTGQVLPVAAPKPRGLPPGVGSPPHPLPASILGSAREGGGKGGRCSARGLLDWT